MPNEKETGAAVDGRPRRLDLVRREARGVALGDHARAHALAALRPRGVRGRTRVQDRDRHRHLPAEGAHRSPVQLRAHLHDEDPVQPRRADGGAAAGGGENGHEACYVRPIAFYGSEKMGVSPIGAKVHVAIAAWPRGAYLGPEALEKGIRVKTSYARHHVNVTMARQDVGYLSELGARDAGGKAARLRRGLLLDVDGFVAEGAGENIFVVKTRSTNPS